MQHYLYQGQPFPFTPEWYRDRHHAPHLEQGVHRPRMQKVADLAVSSVVDFHYGSVVDLGAGDGGMLQLIRETAEAQKIEPPNMWGYDLMPANADFARYHRGVDIRFQDFDSDDIEWGDLVIVTECLEHLQRPENLVKRIFNNARGVIASSPSRETPQNHDECHAWVFDMDGYRALFRGAGFSVVDHVEVRGGYDFQVLFAAKP